MCSYKVIAQSYTTNQRIVKTVIAENEASVMLQVSGELDGFYIVEIRLASC